MTSVQIKKCTFSPSPADVERGDADRQRGVNYGKIMVDKDSLFQRHYNITDHLGNIRVTFTDSGMVIQDDSYYPFGMTMAGLGYYDENREEELLRYGFIAPED